MSIKGSWLLLCVLNHNLKFFLCLSKMLNAFKLNVLNAFKLNVLHGANRIEIAHRLQMNEFYA